MTDLNGTRVQWRQLDGVRAAAVLFVMLYHFYRPHLFTGGYLGVDLFFVLSGFLITWGLVGDWTAGSDRVFARFYTRRALRLFPALAAVTVFGLVLAIFFLSGQLRSQTLHGIPWILLYVGNWARATGAGNLGILAHLWSLSVEEQFYLLWPVIVMALLRRRVPFRRIAVGLLCAAGAEMAYREALYRHGTSVVRLANGLDTHSDALLVGCAVALWLAAGDLPRVPRPALDAGAWISVAVIVVLVLTGNGDTSFQWGYPLTAIAGGALISALVTGGPVPMIAVLQSRPAVWIGRRSYGLYVWSYPIYYGLPWPRSFTGWPRDGAEFALAFAVAAASYRWLELPFLRRKRSFQTGAARPRSKSVVRG